MCEVLVFDVVCDEKGDADTLLTEFAALGINVGMQRQIAIFGAGKRACEAEPLKQEAVYRVSVNVNVFDGNKKAAEKQAKKLKARKQNMNFQLLLNFWRYAKKRRKLSMKLY